MLRTAKQVPYELGDNHVLYVLSIYDWVFLVLPNNKYIIRY